LQFLHANANITQVLTSEYENLFSSVETTTASIIRDVQTVDQNWRDAYVLIIEKLGKMRGLFATIKDAADQWSGKLEVYVGIPGQAIGAIGIVISLLVMFFSVVVRLERQDGYMKHFQLTGQNVLFLVTYTLCDAFVVVSFALSLVFAIVAAFQATLELTCSMELFVCDIVHDELTPAVGLVVAGTILNMLMSYHLTGAMTANYTRFVGGLRHCCGNQLAHHASAYDVNQDGVQGSVSKSLGLHCDETGAKVRDGYAQQLPTSSKKKKKTATRIGTSAITKIPVKTQLAKSVV